MDLVAAGKYIESLEKKHITEIKKMDFLSYNIWKVYRNVICHRLVSEYHVKKQPAIVTLKFRHYLECIIKLKKKALIIVSSAAYNEIKDGKKYSKLVNTISSSIKRNSYNVAIIATVIKNKETGLHPTIDCVHNVIAWIANKITFLLVPFFMKSAYIDYKRLKTFSGLSYKSVLYIKSSFVARFLVYYLLFRIAQPKLVFLLSAPYGYEPLILASKKLDIPSYELQHGHIYKEHYGYNFHQCLKQIKNKFLITDKLYLYGNYWKKLLLGSGFFEPLDLDVCGNPGFDDIKKINIESGDKIPILLCSQPNAKYIFRRFLQNYQDKSMFSDDYFWVIKIHPRELRDDWQDFVSNYDNMMLSDENTINLLNHIDIQVAGTSTTLYEGLYFKTSNYIILDGLNLDDSISFDDGIGKIIESNYIDQFVKFKSVDDKEYFQKYHCIENL